jgi:RND superfamily putative drug exporter
LSSALLRHPRRVLLGAIVCVAVFGLLGINAESKLVPSSVGMPGTESARAEAQLKHYFGESAPFVVLLQGPRAQIELQGPRLVRDLQRDPTVTTLSPWDRGIVGGLRPSPEAAAIVVDFHVSVGTAVDEKVPYISELVERQVKPPLRATATGFASLLRGTKEASDEAGSRGELIALPILLLVLLLVFRSPVAAAVPILIGVASVVTSRGILAILGNWLNIDPVALPVSGMMGLALGVDYALLMVSRFREELEESGSPVAAAARTRRTAGRTILIAGSTLLASLLVAFLVLPRGIFTSLNGAVVLATAISIVMAWVVGPAVLTLLGANVNRWRIGRGGESRTAFMSLVQRAVGHPKVTTVVIVAVLLALAAPILSLNTGSSSLEQLPPNSSVRQDIERISHVAGPGWAAPFIVVASTEDGSVAGQGNLDALARWEHTTTAAPGVKAVIGPGRIATKIGSLREQGNELISGRSRTLSGTRKVGSNLDRAADGVGLLRNGLTQASQGAGLLATGSERATTGARDLAAGAAKAAAFGQKAGGALERLSDGTGRLVSGQRIARFGALQLKLGLGSVLPDLAKGGLGRARPLQRDLARRAQDQPELQEDAERAAALTIRLARAKHEVAHLRKVSAKLYGGLTELAGGGTKLQSGVDRLAQASQQLGSGLGRLDGGSRRLATGLSSLGEGVQTLQQKLAEGAQRSRPLQTGLRRSSTKVGAESTALTEQVSHLRQNSPGLFNSGYFALSTLDGAKGKVRRDANQLIDLTQGGDAVRMLVIGDPQINTPGDAALYSELQRRAAALARARHLEVTVGGGGAQLIDYGKFATARLPLLILLVAAVTYLMLVVFLRSLLLPALAVALNLVTVAVSFGILALVGHIPAGLPLGGNPVLDVGAAMSIFTVAFSLSIDYAVFLVTRMREIYDEDGDHVRAIRLGLQRTARVVTGAAFVMGAVFMAYASAPLAMMSQIGVGLSVAVLLDATVIRIFLLPALMRLVGDRVWWLPAPLARTLPRLGAH